MSEEKKHYVKISIIIPLYNMQQYIGRCLDSILEQTFPDFEVICVDDGSTDESRNICEQYGQKDARIKVYHTVNQGVSQARNYGLSKVTGEWFAFIDADDWVETDYLKVLYENAVKYSCNVSACAFRRDMEYSLGYDSSICETILFHSMEECIHSFICLEKSMEGMACNKLYRTNSFKDICFEEDIKVNEDCLYTFEIMKRCDRACLSTAPLYHWFYRADSASRTKTLSNDFGAAKVFLRLYHETKFLNDADVLQTLQKNYICAVLKILMYAKYEKRDCEVQEAKKQCKLWKKDVWHLLDDKTKLKYIFAMYMPWIFCILQ